MRAHLLRAAGYAWAGPFTLLALVLLVAPARVLRARVRLVAGVVEATGGPLPRALSRLLPGLSIAALTVGHVVLARSRDEAARWRAHERVHVAQWARWGLLFPLAYLGASLVARLRGRDPYLDNPFEREAFRAGGGDGEVVAPSSAPGVAPGARRDAGSTGRSDVAVSPGARDRGADPRE